MNRRLFLSAKVSGAFGGASAADSTCQSTAANAGLTGTWLAVIGANALTRFSGPGPFMSINAVVIFANRAGLSKAPLAALVYDVAGTSVSGTSVWTGARADCTGWTTDVSTQSGTIGDVVPSGGDGWLDEGTYPCATKLRLLCAEQ